MNNPVLNPPQNGPIPMNQNPQINLVANLQINPNPNPIINTPVAVPVPNADQPVDVPLIDDAVLLPDTEEQPEIQDEEYEQQEQEYDTGHSYMELQDDFDLNEEKEDNDNDNKLTIQLCIYRIRTDLQTPFLEFLVERTDEIPQYHLPLYTADEADETDDNTALQNNLLRKIEILLNNSDTLETPRFLGFQTQPEGAVIAFYDLSVYSINVLSENDGSIQWILLNQINEENGFHPDTLAFFQQNIHIRTLYHIPTQEEIPPPVLVYHSFSKPTRTDDPIFGFPFVYTEKPLFSVDESIPKKNPVETDDGEKEKPETEPRTDKPQNNLLSSLNPLSTTNRSYPFILFPPPLEKTMVILKQEFQDVSPELWKKYNDVFLKKVCIRYLKDGVDYWIVKSPLVAVPYEPFQQGSLKQTPVASRSTASNVSFLPQKTTSSLLTTPSAKSPVIDKATPSSFHLNLKNLLNPHRITERANMVKLRG